MAAPSCVKCGHATFSGTMRNIPSAGRNVVFVHCEQCGAVVGVVEQVSAWNVVHAIAKKLGLP